MKSKANVVVLKTEDREVTKKRDGLKWSVVVFLLLAALIGNYYYSEVSLLIRIAGWAVVLALGGFVASKTQKGAWVIEFFRESRLELRKVVWPTREETMQTTMVVAVMVIILALLLWGLDGILVWAIGWLTGQRG